MIKKIIFTDRNNDLLTIYLKDISKYKILTNDEICELVKLAQNGDERAKDKVVTSNLRFVVTLAKQFQNRGVPLMDLISSGNEGLIKSVTKYDPEKGTTFLSYAAWWIKQCIYNSIYWHGKEIRLPITQQMLLIEIIDATTKFIQQHHRDPSSLELSEITEIPVNQIDHLSQYFNSIKSVDDYVGGDDDNMTLAEVIPDDESSLDIALNKEYVTNIIENLMLNLSIREQDVIRMWYGIGMNSICPKIIANMFGVGKERIRQIKEAGLSKLRKKHKILKTLL